jgi:curved DNA-binding protein CbpA
MQYNGKFTDPYEILALPHASDFELVKATFKSLVKIYHPDVFKGDKDFAKERLSQLNAAYEFLSDEQQKREFDKSPESQEKSEEQSEFDPDQNSDEFDEGFKILKENWDFACEYHPELKTLYEDLKVLSKEPAFVFMAFVVETKKFKEGAKIAKTLENAFLSTKFSDDFEIRKIAKFAIQQKEIEFAKKLNRALKILGVDSKIEILRKLSEQFPVFAHKAYRAYDCYHLISSNHPEIQDEAKSLKQVLWACFGLFIVTILLFILIGIFG